MSDDLPKKSTEPAPHHDERLEASGRLVLPEQKQLYFSAMARIANVISVFVEIQGSGNPLTCQEIRKLMEKDPARYGCLRAYLKD